jgi:S1-C subfamily serine protease
MKFISNIVHILISSVISVFVTIFLLNGYSFQFETPKETTKITTNTSSPFPNFTQLATKTTPSVVALEVEKNGKDSDNLFYGSGVVFTFNNQHYILTNNHVIEDSKKIEAIFQDQKENEVFLVGSDHNKDLAILTVGKRTHITPATLGDSSSLQVGDWVLAIGNPLGIKHTLTAGIVSAMNKEITMDDLLFKDLIQTDAAINPGSSGGPLFNTKGEVIGINTAILEDAQGIGFSIPINDAKKYIKTLIENGSIEE